MKKYFILLAFILAAVPANVQAETTYNKTANLYDYGYQKPVSQDSINKLVEIENTLYGQVYDEQNLLARIERLENTVYNRYYPDYTLDRRLSNLIYSYNKRYRHRSPSRLGNVVNRFNSAFIGVPTGFTPPISTDPYYNYNYNPAYRRYNSSFGSNGWRTYGSNIGTGTGIHILD